MLSIKACNVSWGLDCLLSCLVELATLVFVRIVSEEVTASHVREVISVIACLVTLKCDEKKLMIVGKHVELDASNAQTLLSLSSANIFRRCPLKF